MAKTASTMLALGTQAPAFSLPDACTGKVHARDDFKEKQALLVMFISNHCPFVIHIRGHFKRLEEDYAPRGVQIVAITSSSEQTHPQDGPSHMRALAEAEGWGFPFLFDRTQEVAKAFRAACTPDFFLFDRERRLVYRGQFDDARPGNQVPVTGRDLRAALDAVLAGRPVSADQRPSLGCNIKWHPGQEPDYFTS